MRRCSMFESVGCSLAVRVLAMPVALSRLVSTVSVVLRVLPNIAVKHDFAKQNRQKKFGESNKMLIFVP